MSRVNIISQRHALCFSMVVICIWLLFPLSALAKVEKRSGDHSSVVLAYLYNFGKFVSWPKELTSPQTSPIIYCFYGSLASSESIHFLENKTLRGRPIQVLAKAISDSTMECDLVYIDNYGLDKVHVDYLINLSPVRHQLTVSSADNFIESGGVIGLFSQNHKLRFEINAMAAKEAEIKMSSQLLRLASRVKES